MRIGQISPFTPVNTNNNYVKTQHNSTESINKSNIAFGDAEDSGGILVDLAILGTFIGLPLGLIGSCCYKASQSQEKALEYVYHKRTEDKLMDIYKREDSDRGGKYSLDEQLQMREILDAKERITKEFPASSGARRELEDLHDKLLDNFSAPDSDHGSKITYEEQELILDFMKERAKMIKRR